MIEIGKEIGLMERRGDLGALLGSRGHGRMSGSQPIRMKHLGLGAGIGMMIDHILDMRLREENIHRKARPGMMNIKVNGKRAGVGIAVMSHQGLSESTKTKRVRDMGIKRVGGIEIEIERVRDMVILGGRRTSTNRANIENGTERQTGKVHESVAVVIESHHRKGLMTNIINAAAGLARDPEIEAGVVNATVIILGNELGRNPQGENGLQHQTRKKERLQMTQLRRWATSHWMRHLYRRVDLINL